MPARKSQNRAVGLDRLSVKDVAKTAADAAICVREEYPFGAITFTDMDSGSMKFCVKMASMGPYGKRKDSKILTGPDDERYIVMAYVSLDLRFYGRINVYVEEFLGR